MPTGRSHLFALLSAVVALVPGMAIGGSVDVHVTAAVPAPDAPQAPGEMQPAPPPASIAQLKNGLDALAANDIAGARNARDTLPAISLDRHILAWAIALYGGDQVPSGEIADEERRPLPAMSADEAAIVNYATEFFQTHKVSQKTFQAALDQFGAQHLTELTALMGHYAQTAFFLNAFEVQLPEQRTEPVLPV